MRMNPDGTVEGTPDEIAAFKHIDAALAAKNGRALKQGKAIPAKKKRKPKEVETVEISDVLAQTLEYLSKNTDELGLSAEDVAKGMGIKPATATYRLNRLAKLGVVTRPSRGMFLP